MIFYAIPLEKFTNSIYKTKVEKKRTSRKKKRKNGGSKKWQQKKKTYGYY